jgi:hypothetical protein
LFVGAKQLLFAAARDFRGRGERDKFHIGRFSRRGDASDLQIGNSRDREN